MPTALLRLHGMQPGEEPMDLPRLLRIVEEKMTEDCRELWYWCKCIKKIDEPITTLVVWAEVNYIVIDGNRLKLTRKPKRTNADLIIFAVKPWLQQPKKLKSSVRLFSS